MSTTSSPALPPWATDVIDLYESGASCQFILHGNVADLVLLPVSGDTLHRLHQMVEEENTKAAGRARVARDGIDTTRFKEKASECEALEDIALADLAAELGIAVPGAQTAVAPTEIKKEMNPQ